MGKTKIHVPGHVLSVVPGYLGRGRLPTAHAPGNCWSGSLAHGSKGKSKKAESNQNENLENQPHIHPPPKKLETNPNRPNQTKPTKKPKKPNAMLKYPCVFSAGPGRTALISMYLSRSKTCSTTAASRSDTSGCGSWRGEWGCRVYSRGWRFVYETGRVDG